MAIKASIGTSTIIVFGTSSFAANVVSLGLNRTLPVIDATHLGTTGGRDFIQGKLTDGELSMEISFDSKATIPLGEAPETITITYALQVSTSGTAASHSFTGFISSADIGVPGDDKITASITVKIAGVVTEILEQV